MTFTFPNRSPCKASRIGVKASSGGGSVERFSSRVGQTKIAALEFVGQAFVVDAEVVQDRRLKVVEVDGGFGRGLSSLALANLLHRTNATRRKRTAVGFEMADDIFGDVAQLSIQLGRIVSMNARNEIGAFTKIGSILFAPLDPFVILITLFHFAPRRLRLALETLDRAWRRRQIVHST